MAEAGQRDASLVLAIRSGRPEAFETFFRRYESAVYRTAYGFVRDPMLAEEIVCDTFLRAYDARLTLDPDRSPLPWLQRVAVNLAITRLRRSRLSTESIDDVAGHARRELSDTSPGPVERRETEIVLSRGLERLPTQLRTVVVLRYIVDLSVTEIASLLHEPRSTVKHRLNSALRRLRTDLEDRRDTRIDEVAGIAPVTVVVPVTVPGTAPGGGER